MKRFWMFAGVAAFTLMVQLVDAAKVEALGICTNCTLTTTRARASSGHDDPNAIISGFFVYDSFQLLFTAATPTTSYSPSSSIAVLGPQTFSSAFTITELLQLANLSSILTVDSLTLNNNAEIDLLVGLLVATDPTTLTSSRINALGDVTLNGMLNVVSTPNYTAQAGDTVSAIACSIILGDTFDLTDGWKPILTADGHGLNLMYMGAGYNWSPGSGSAPVPEPSTVILLGAGLAGLAGAGYRRRKQAEKS